MTTEDGPLMWVADVPLVTNPVVLRALAWVLGLAYVLIVGIFAVILGVDDHLERLPTFMAAMLFGFAIVTVLIVLVMIVFCRNRMRMRFILDDEGMTSVIVDRRTAIANSLAVVAGAASANPTLVGSGLIAEGTRREYTRWDRVSAARYDPGRHFIGLVAAGWWPVGAIHCTAESYPAVETRVRRILGDAGPPEAR